MTTKRLIGDFAQRIYRNDKNLLSAFRWNVDDYDKPTSLRRDSNQCQYELNRIPHIDVFYMMKLCPVPVIIHDNVRNIFFIDAESQRLMQTYNGLVIINIIKQYVPKATCWIIPFRLIEAIIKHKATFGKNALQHVIKQFDDIHWFKDSGKNERFERRYVDKTTGIGYYLDNTLTWITQPTFDVKELMLVRSEEVLGDAHWINKSVPADTVFIKEQYHRLGGYALRYNNRYWVLGVDDRSYFASNIPKFKSIKDAYMKFMPKAIRNLPLEERRKVLRQGEWFCIPTNISRKQFEQANICTFHRLPLPTQQGGNWHTVHHCKIKNEIYAWGMMTHSQHPNVKMGQMVYRIVKNTSKMDFSLSLHMVD